LIASRYKISNNVHLRYAKESELGVGVENFWKMEVGVRHFISDSATLLPTTGCFFYTCYPVLLFMSQTYYWHWSWLHH